MLLQYLVKYHTFLTQNGEWPIFCSTLYNYKLEKNSNSANLRPKLFPDSGIFQTDFSDYRIFVTDLFIYLLDNAEIGFCFIFNCFLQCLYVLCVFSLELFTF